MRSVRVFLVMVVMGLAACGGDSSRNAVPESASLLVPAGSEEALSRHLKAGWKQLADGSLMMREAGFPEATLGVTAEADQGAAAPGGDDAGGGSAEQNFTNVQVDGVDEADQVKTDGHYLYVAEAGGWGDVIAMAEPLAIMPEDDQQDGTARGDQAKSDEEPGVSADLMIWPPERGDASPAQIARYRLSPASISGVPMEPLVLEGSEQDSFSRLDMLLTAGDEARLAVLGQRNSWHWGNWFRIMPYAPEQDTRLWLFDVTSPEAVPAPRVLTLPGELVDSRRIGQHLYVVSRYSPDLETDSLVPSWVIDGVSQPLVEAKSCLLPAEAQGFPSLTLVMAIDLANPAQINASCYAGSVYTFYMSSSAVYLATVEDQRSLALDSPMVSPGIRTLASTASSGSGATSVALPANVPQKTLIHRFDLNDGQPTYVASGAVPGGFTGWTGTGSQPQWRFHERDGRLIVVTSWWDKDIEHQLYVLSPGADGRLVVTATLPNSQRPAPIGKPREDIFAMRYVGERAYIVTFEQTDPLYVVDLSNLDDPSLAGELELPGFSAYLHPAGNDWLLGIGRGGEGGIEANLFDVRDPANPRVHTNLSLCRDACDTSLLTDYHAIAIQQRGDELRVALPISRWGEQDGSWWSGKELALLSVSTDTGGLLKNGVFASSTAHEPLDRALIVEDAVYFPHLGHLGVTAWP